MIGERITKLREEKKLSRKEVCEALDIKLRTYASYEKDERHPHSETLKSISDFFGVSIDYLLGLDVEPNKKSSTPELSDIEQRMLKAFKNLSSEDQLIELGRIELMAELSAEKNK